MKGRKMAELKTIKGTRKARHAAAGSVGGGKKPTSAIMNRSTLEKFIVRPPKVFTVHVLLLVNLVSVPM
jgi:hypothetical protein